MTQSVSEFLDNSLPSNIKTTAAYQREQENLILDGDGGAMGQSAFLTLFTTQLQNQNPLDPMENEAFVAQLAQFSQLEATTKMSDNLQNLIASLSNERMSSAAGLIGKKVSIPDGKAILSDEKGIQGNIKLENDVDSINIKIYSSDGKLIREGEIGPQKKGQFPFAWDGKNQDGKDAPKGTYRIDATVNRFGKLNKAPVSSMSDVKSVTTDPATGDMRVEFYDGSTMSMREIIRVGV